jgi:hypothetical protein
MSPHQAIKTVSKDTQAITEIFQEYVSRDALRKDGLEYTRVLRKRIVGGEGLAGGGPGGREVEEQCYCIEGALRPEEVKRLVERTKRYRGEMHAATSPLPRSPRSALKTAVLAAPPLDRSNTAPILGNKFRETHTKEVERATSSLRHWEDSTLSNTTSASNTSDSESNYKTSSSSRPRSKSRHGESRHRRDSPRSSYDRDEDHRRSSRSRGGDKEKKRGGSGKMQTATKIAAGAGLATLLDGLPEMLAYL